MSIIMAVGNKHKLILASDGRVSDTDAEGNHIVLEEKFKKIFRLSHTVYALIAGDRGQCMWIIHTLQCDFASTISPQTCSYAIEKLIQNHLLSSTRKLNVRMIVAGFNFVKDRELCVISADKESIERERIPLNEDVIYVAKGDIEEGEQDYFYPILNSSRDMKISMKLCISEASKRHKGVNNVVFFEEL